MNSEGAEVVDGRWCSRRCLDAAIFVCEDPSKRRWRDLLDWWRHGICVVRAGKVSASDSFGGKSDGEEITSALLL